MKSILKTINVSSVSSFALIGMLSILVTACGSDADQSDPRRFDTPLYVNDDRDEDLIHNAGPEMVLIGDETIELDINDEYVELGAVARDIWDVRNMKDQVPTTTAGYVVSGSLLVSSDVEPNSTEYEVVLFGAEDLEVGMEVDIEIHGLIVTRLPKNTAEITSIEVIESAATTTIMRLKFQNAISHALQEGLDHLATGTLSGGSDVQGKILINVGVQPVLIQGSVDSTQPGNYTISYTATDSSDNSNTITRAVIVADRTPPVITISGDNPVLAVSGDAFVIPPATYYDLFDDTPDDSFVTNITNNVDTSAPGNYTVTYTASDASGNEATKNLTVIVEPDYQDEIVLFSNGSLAEGWRQNGYDVDLSYGDCPGNTCPNLDYGIENDPIKGRDVMYIDHGVDNAAQAGFFMQTELNVDPIDLRGAEVNGILTFEVWSDSPDGVDLNVAVDCPAYPNAGSPVLLESVGAQEWQEISIPASSLFNESCALRSDEIGTIPMFLSRWMGPKIRIDNVIWKCEFSCDGSDIPDAVYTPWVKVDKTVGFDAPNSYPGYNLVWSDEFDGTAVDQTKWNLENAGGGFGNSELQYYRPENASVEDGLLVITADIQQSDDAELPGGESFSSAKLTTQDKLEFKHGRVDIRAAVAEGKGMWSAGWMLGANVDDIGWPFAGEIDIVETIGGVHYGVDQENRMVHNAYWNAEGPFAPGQYLTPRQYQDAKYSPTPSGQSTAWGERELLTEGETFSNTFHVFSIEWDEEKIRYMIDGVYVEGRDLDLTTNVVSPCPHGQVANEPQLSCLGQSYDNDFFLILNVAVGGTFPGAPDSTSQFPRGMLVDYVRVYQTAAQQAAQ